MRINIEEIEESEAIQKGSIIKGLKVFILPSGTIVKVIDHAVKTNRNIGEILIC